MLRQFGIVSERCTEWQMPLVAMVYTRGPKINDEYNANNVKHAARVGAELGADIVKVPYTGSVETFQPGHVDGGHGGGDSGIMQDFVAAVRGVTRSSSTTARASLESHLMAFAAEEARVSGQMLDMAAYRQQVEAKALNKCFGV